ncbi:winged helix-turn-helix domain-containing protein [Parafrankia discariae]|uniref:winged helix-turn-helix domain-containing protein n=1 Tax=Parafrankia discariae TaxID=365528 RepID=UPI0003A520CE|nr:winged helix-turn-helix domain-containing protein [Parafrankia discariae]
MTAPAVSPRSPIPPEGQGGIVGVPGGAWLEFDAAAWGRSGRALPGRPRRELSPRIAGLLGRGDTGGHFGHGRSAVSMSVALGAVGAGWSLEELRKAFVAVAHVVGTPGDWMVRDPRGRRRSVADQDHRLEHMWRNAVVRWCTRSPASDVQQTMVEIAVMREAADARPFLWGGQAGGSNRAVLEALWEIGARAGRLDPTASIRQIAEATTVTDSTVDRAVHRLIAAGWLRVDEPAGVVLVGEEDEHGRRGGQLRARRLHLLLPRALPDPVDPDELADPRSGELPATRWRGRAVHDVFTWRGLGTVAGRIYDTLETTGVRCGLLAARVGFTRSTVRKHLRRLAAAGLARRGGDGWVRGSAGLDVVAVALGVDGTLAGRAERHAVQREQALAYFVERANRRGWRVERGMYRPSGRPTGTPTRLPLPVQRAETRIPLGL